MGKKLKRVGIAVVVVFAAIQFIRPAKNELAAATNNDITKMYPVPDSVQKILDKACLDCHSDNTRYPWYANIQPVYWWMNDHINDGKRELNFSEFGTYTLLKQAKKLKKSAKEVDKGGMPLNSYLWEHSDATLSPAEKQTYMAWANNLSQQLYAKVSPEDIAEDKRQHELKKAKQSGK